MSTLAITYLGHSSAIIRIDGKTLYTDPHFGRRALWPKRRVPVPRAVETLPPPDAILVSHAHYDHLDLHSFKYFSSKIPVFVPVGLASFLAKHVRNPIVELKVDGEFSLSASVKLHGVAVKHHGGRWSHLRFHQCIGFVIEGSTGTVFFPGDTAYDDSLKQVTQFGPLRAALLPIGPCYPRVFMKHRHLNPEEALQLTEELNPDCMIPIHWGVFRLGLEGPTTPLHWLQARLTDSVVREKVCILQPGESWQRESTASARR